jgi:hypothetical protein
MTATIGVESLDGTLAVIHDRWVSRLAAVLSPAMAPRSRFWERWEVTRCFAGEFQYWLQVEFAVVESLGGLLSPEARVRLATQRAALERIGIELMSSTRHQWRPAPLAILSRQLLELTRCWCAELERVTRGLTLEDISQPGRMVLERMAMKPSRGDRSA